MICLISKLVCRFSRMPGSLTVCYLKEDDDGETDASVSVTDKALT